MFKKYTTGSRVQYGIAMANRLNRKACNFRKGNKYIDPEIVENNAEITKNGVDKA